MTLEPHSVKTETVYQKNFGRLKLWATARTGEPSIHIRDQGTGDSIELTQKTLRELGEWLVAIADAHPQEKP
jgi:hypothetical protein